MNVKPFLIALLISLLIGICHESSNAQPYPAKLLTEIPESAEILSSPDIRVRASILKKLVVPVPRSCTGQQDLPVNLDREDYEFVVERILELDLMPLNYKEDAYIWGKLAFLITKFEMHQHLEALTRYLSHPEMYVQAGIIYTLQRLGAKDFDSKLVPLLDSPEKFIRDETLRTLIQFGSRNAVPPLLKLLEHPDHLQRYYALTSLAKVDGVEAAPHISRLLNDPEENNRYWAIDTLVKLNARSQADKLWESLKTERNERFTGFALAALLYFEQRDAVPVALEIFKGYAKNEGNFHVLEFVNQLKPRILISEIIALYHQKERFYESDEHENKMRLNLFNLLCTYRTSEAIPIYRENLFRDLFRSDNNNRTEYFNEGVAQILLGLGAVGAVDDLITGLNDVMKERHSSYYDMRVGIIAHYLAKFANKKANKVLIDVVEVNRSQYRSSIIAELNKQLDPEMWRLLDSRKLGLIPIESIESFSEKASEESGVRIVFEKEKTSEAVSCLSQDITLTDAIPCAYSDGRMSTLQSLQYMFTDRRNRKYTWIFDGGKVRILSVERAVDWWRKTHLSQ